MEWWINFELAFLGFVILTCTSVRSCAFPKQLVAVRDTTQTFTSPNYPHYYPHNSKCSWLITTHNSSDVIQIVTRYMDLEKRFGSYDCIFDYVAAHDGHGSSSDKLGQWCDKTKRTYVSSGQSIYVIFRSDNSQNGKGFVIDYQSGRKGSFGEIEEESSEMSMMQMVGYVVFVLTVLAIGMVIIRVTLIKTKRCKCCDRSTSLNQRTRVIFTRRRNNCASHSRTGSFSATLPDVFVVPMPPPSYEEVVLQGGPGLPEDAPPPYTPGEFPTSSDDDRDLDISEHYVYNNEGYSPPPSPPPPYEVREAMSTASDTASCANHEGIASANTNSSRTRTSLSSQDDDNALGFVPVG